MAGSYIPITNIPFRRGEKERNKQINKQATAISSICQVTKGLVKRPNFLKNSTFLHLCELIRDIPAMNVESGMSIPISMPLGIILFNLYPLRAF